MPSRRWWLTAVLVAAAGLLLGRGAAQVYTDYLWYAALGAADVWRAKAAAIGSLRTACALAATLFVFANLYAVRQSVVSLVLPRRLGNIDIGEEVPREQLTYAAALASVGLGVSMSWSRDDWSALVAAWSGRPFGESDPYFAEDLAFFVHRLPLEQSLFQWAMVVLLISIGAVILLYALTPSLRWERGGLYVSAYVRRHLAMLAGVLLLALAWHYRLQMYAVLGAGGGADGAFTYFDHRVAIPASLIVSVVTLGAGLTVIWAGWTGQMRLAFAAITGVLLVVLAARQAAPFIARRTMAARDPVARERPYEATRAGYTRRAFAVDRIEPADPELVFASLRDAAPHVPLWDDGALQPAAGRGFPGAGVAWQVIDSAMLAIVPMDEGTSGAGRFLTGVAEESGAPVRVPTPEAGGAMPRSLIVPDSAASPMIVADSGGRIAAPILSGTLVRLAYALSMQDVRILLSQPPSPAPRIVTRRSVRTRIAALAPFFAQGSLITPVWVADTLAWAVDMYSSSPTYPLSRRILVAGEERAYFQYAATAIVNSASGRVLFVPDSAPDPVAATWIARFPRLFVRPTALRAGLFAQLPPARDGARAQAISFGRYGTRGETDVTRFVTDDEGADSALASTPAPPIGVPRAGASGHVVPLLDRSDRLRGLVVALGGPSRRTLWLPAAEPTLVWGESLDRLRAADTLTTPSLVRGFVRPVPIGNRVVLVQPRYDWRGGSPRLAYVSAAFGDTIRSARSLYQLAGRPQGQERVSNADFRTRVRELYEDMRRASARGDWGTYGRAFDALGALVRSPPR